VAYLGNDLQVAFPTYRNIDDISGSFNGVTTSFPLTVDGVAPIPAPVNSQQCLISVNGVVQRPDDSGAEGFLLSGGNIVFASAPAGGVDFFGVILAGADYINIGANFPSGTALVPSITFDSDLDTGIYNPAGNQIGFTTAGVQRLVINSSGQVSGGLGSATTPAFSFLSDPNTGIYSPGADQVAVATNGTGRLFINALGQVGVGTSSPSEPLDVVSASGTARAIRVRGRSADNIGLIDFYSSDNATRYATIGAGAANTFVVETANNERLRVDSSGRVGIGTSSPIDKLHVDGRIAVTTDSSTPTTGEAFFYKSSSGAVMSGFGATIETGGAGSRQARVSVDSSGNVGIGTTSPGSIFDVKPSASSSTLRIEAGTINS
jgi:hypothetical protein